MSGPFHDWGTADSYEHYEPPVSIGELLASYEGAPTEQLTETLQGLLVTPPKQRGPLTTRTIAAIEILLEERRSPSTQNSPFPEGSAALEAKGT